jgi:DNA-binding transcriptional LysR family regulator
MKMHQIRYFLALCEERSFMRAAKRCGVSQPSLTNGIRTLEEELGGNLFTRRPRIALTPLGSAVRPRLKRIVQDAANVLETAHRMRRMSAGPTLLVAIAQMAPAEQLTTR